MRIQVILLASGLLYRAVAQTKNNTCFEDSKQPGCNDLRCASAVCKIDEGCCGFQWDKACVLTVMANLEVCTNDWPPQINTCFEEDPFGRPNCTDPVCNELVCATQPRCCEESYDEGCAQLAKEQCERSTPENTCFEPSSLPGCFDSGCLGVVCDAYQPCCEDAYSQVCIEIARQFGGICVPPVVNHTCLEESVLGGCNDSDCEAAVCEIRPGCCNGGSIGEWSASCVQIAEETCYRADPDPENHCFEASLFPGCADSICLESVCVSQPSCCDSQYSVLCVETARQHGDVCRPPLTNNMCSDTSTFGGCTDPECEALVCEFRSECCNDDTTIGEWSNACVNIAQETCRGKSCFEKSIDPGCSDPVCEEIVCDLDSFCCRRDWDSNCISLAMDNLDMCPYDWPEQQNTCFEAEPFGRSNCSDPVCKEIVCLERPGCCQDGYDEKCREVALTECELPASTNHCLQTSLMPGCTESGCLEVVCDKEESCCTSAYSEECVAVARENGLICHPPDFNNTCLEKSPYGGCNDVRCASTVCEINPDCCDGEVIGEWASVCTRIAEEICQPEVVPKPPGVCPFGYTCGEEFMANCTQLRLTARDGFNIGDIYAGIFCGHEGDEIRNCEVGMYCPTPEVMIPCPANFFCPHKTQTPQIVCHGCEEGATQLVRDRFGYVILVILAGLTLMYIVYKTVKRYNKDFINRLEDFEKRVFIHRLQEFEHRMVDFTYNKSSKLLSFVNNKQQAHELKKIRHKVELINRRLATLEEKEPSQHLHSHSHSSSLFRAFGRSLTGNQSLKGGEADREREVEFDARRVFDALDVDSNGELTFKELNIILGLDELELSEFGRRMNELAGQRRERESVTRPVFVKYFLPILKETSNLTVSFEEAGALFDEFSGIGKIKLNEIHMSKFYNSSMTNFLSDLQICDLINRFKVFKKTTNHGYSSRMGRSSFINMGSTAFRRPSFRRPSLRENSSFYSKSQSRESRESLMMVSREDFVEHYPQLLLEITIEADSPMGEPDGDNMATWQYPGIDICFKDLSLSIQVGENSINVVDKVTGRIRAKTMTALMGGSGAGKTSLLNALCGRAFYGDVTGSIYVNGKQTTIEEHKDSVGFVPQDDIVWPSLTVRENLVFSGRFRLPRGTSEGDIEDLADLTLASLGLSRVAESPVGDVNKRGVSGGERKRVNIGIELMANPSVLFLDEPTSGLDASSALLVMKSLKHLVEKEGVTVVSVIHQPRKFIYDLFDSLILLGVGGNMVYHGPTNEATAYFNRLHYSLPSGESVADWMVDISSGRLEPDNQIAACKNLEGNPELSRREGGDTDSEKNENDASLPFTDTSSNSTDELKDSDGSITGAIGLDQSEVASSERSQTNVSSEHDVERIGHGGPIAISAIAEKPVDSNETKRLKRVPSSSSLLLDEVIPPPADFLSGFMDADCVGNKGVTTGKVVQAFEEAKVRRAWLYDEWNKYFNSLSDSKKKLYEIPSEYQLPASVIKPTFLYQLKHQVRRSFTVAWRTRFVKLIECTVIVGAVIIMTALDGVAEVTMESEPEIPFEVMVRPVKEDVEILFTELFGYALTRQIQYPLKIGIIISVLLGLTAMRIVTDKRLQFFREAGSGYNLNAYFFAVNIMATLEHSVQVLIAAFFAFWIRNPLASAGSFFVHFFLLAWVTVSWALFIPMVVSPDSVVLVAGFFFTFCGLMFSGAFPPIIYRSIYETGGLPEIFAGWIAPTRFFYEALAVGEYRCLPEQSGFTIGEEATNRAWNSSAFAVVGYAGHDPTATERSCTGWYWSVVPSLLVGFTIRFAATGAMHAFNRAQQTKKPLMCVMKSDKRVFATVVLYLVILCGLFVLTTWLFLREVPYVEVDRTDVLSQYIL